jgi:hypothetical protein
MDFLLNGQYDIQINPGQKFHLNEGDTLENEKISYEASKDGFYQFTGHWFFFLF